MGGITEVFPPSVAPTMPHSESMSQRVTVVSGAFPSAAPTTLHAATTGRVILGAVPAPLQRYAPIG